jgi:hypothetical protein
MCPSAWVIAWPAAIYLAVQELAQRTTMVRGLASVATSRSPARTPALISSWPGQRKMLSVPGAFALGEPVGEIRGDLGLLVSAGLCRRPRDLAMGVIR